MSEWTDGYRAALADVERLAPGRWLAVPRPVPADVERPEDRFITIPGFLAELLRDLAGDALVVERETDNRIRRRRLAAVREAMLPFDEAPP